MLGCLLEDLGALAAALAGEESTGEDRALRALYVELRDAARRLWRELGGPVAPDDPGEPVPPDRRRKRMVRSKSKDRAAAVEPPPEQEPESSSGGEWTGRGFSPFLIRSLHQAGLSTVEAFRHLTREEFLALDGLGPGALTRCEKALGIRLPSAGWIAKGATPEVSAKLARAGIRMPEDLKRYSPEDLRALGFHSREISLCKRLTK